MLTYGDGLADLDPRKTRSFHNKQENAVVTLTSVQSAGRFGSLEMNREGKILSFKEKPTHNSWINAGYMVCDYSIFNYLGQEDFAKTLENLAACGFLATYQHKGFFKPLDTPRDKAEIEKLWNEGNAQWKVW
jgi:glucose-1-phosphate cytidylyltransferase